MHDIEIAKNAATNGRWFNGLVAATMIALAVTQSDIYFLGALSSALSIGAAYVCDLSRRSWLGYASIGFAVLPFAIVALKGF